MTDEERFATIRAFRAWLGLEQREAGIAAGVGEKRLIDAEKGRVMSERTWKELTAFYASRGLEIREGEPLIILVR